MILVDSSVAPGVWHIMSLCCIMTGISIPWQPTSGSQWFKYTISWISRLTQNKYGTYYEDEQIAKRRDFINEPVDLGFKGMKHAHSVKVWSIPFFLCGA